MNHEPYENWILEDHELAQEEEQAMQAHLNNCPECKQLQQSWKGAHHQMRSLSMVSPRSGFSQRWRASLVERRAYQQKLQSRRFFMLLAALTIAILFLLFGVILATTSPVYWVVVLISTLFHLFFQVTQVSSSVLSWIYLLPVSIPVAFWIFLTSLLAVLSLVWTYSLWHIIRRKGVTTS